MKDTTDEQDTICGDVHHPNNKRKKRYCNNHNPTKITNYYLLLPLQYTALSHAALEIPTYYAKFLIQKHTHTATRHTIASQQHSKQTIKPIPFNPPALTPPCHSNSTPPLTLY